jgi:hypothetical protein
MYARNASKRQFIRTFFRFGHMHDSFEQALATKKAFACQRAVLLPNDSCKEVSQ